MWIHQRTSRNTSVSAPFWAYGLGVMVIAGLVLQAVEAAWPLLVGATVLYAAYLAWRGLQHRQHIDEAPDGCLFCHNQVLRLARQEAEQIEWTETQARRDAAAANAARLRAKYPKV